jgi:hypothetical protein
VGDYTYSVIFAFSHDGTFHGRVGTTKGFLIKPTSIAIKPAAPLPSLSSSSPPFPLSPAGTPAVFPVELHGPRDVPIPNSYDVASDVFLYHAEAAYVDPSTGASVTLPCAVVYDEVAPRTAALSVSCELTLATTYTVSVFHSRTNPQLLGGVRHVLTIEPAATDPDWCAVDFPSGKSIVAGSSFGAVVLPFDEFKNPTSHAEDAFESSVELGSRHSSGATAGNRHVLPADHAFSEIQKIAGT